MPDQFHTTECKQLVENFRHLCQNDILIQKVPVKVYSSYEITLWACPLEPEKRDSQYVSINSWAFWSFLRNLATAGCGIKNTLDEIDYVFLEGKQQRLNFGIDKYRPSTDGE